MIVTLLKYLSRERFDLALGVVTMADAVYFDDIPEDVEFIDLQARRVRNVPPKLIGLVNSWQPDVIFSTLWHLNLLLAILKPIFFSKIIVIGRENKVVSEWLKYQDNKFISKLAYRVFYKKLDYLVCQSQDMLKDMVDSYGISSDKSSVIYNPLDIDKVRKLSGDRSEFIHLSPSEGNAINFVSAGRISVQKGFDILLEAFFLCSDLPITLSILGEGILKDQLQEKASDYGIEDRIFFKGFKKNPYSWFAKADAFILSSRYEGFPNVVLEALACGTPVIATPAPGGIHEILDKIPQCEIAEAISAPALARSIRNWVNRHPGRVPDEIVAPYAVEHVVRQYEDVICRHFDIC